MINKSHHLAAYITLCILLNFHSHAITDTEGQWEWVGKGQFRIIVEVPARDLNGRESDQGPAKILLDVGKISLRPGKKTYIDADSIEVIAYDATTGKPVQQTSLRNRSVYDIAHRWDDFDHRSQNFYYHRKGNQQKGELIWNHTQNGDKPSYYAIYFDVKDSIKDTTLGPMPMVGDGDPIYGPDEPLFAGMHLKTEIVDWDSDGLLDFLLGDTPGYLQLYKNTGTKCKPCFRESVFLKVDDHVFCDRYSPAFCAVDWDDDGDIDLIYGKEMGGEVFYLENIGTRSKSRLISGGQLLCDGKPLKTPGKPFPDKPDPSDAWRGVEYMCTPAVVDWDADGDKDLLLGSYSGGQVYYCENLRNEKGLPQLTWRGFLSDVDGMMIDSDFAASPEIADYDGDGDLDMILGAADWTENAGSQPPDISTNLLYYENIGSRSKPALKKRPFPDELQGKGINCVAVPSAGDLDNDGDLDLIVGTYSNVVTYKNVGTRNKPYFHCEGPLKTGWNPVMFGGFSSTPFDIDHDGDMDIIASDNGKFKVIEQIDNLNPPHYKSTGYLNFGDKLFQYIFPLGDSELFSSADDLDQDGLIDLLFGTADGMVWFCKNLGIKDGKVRFAKNRLLMLKNGSPVKVGHYTPKAKATNFAAHSGDRPDPELGDFDGDSDMDLMVSDAYGAITYFENVNGNENPVFASGCVIKEEDNRRLLQEVVDWNGDSRPDILFCRSGIEFWCNISDGKHPQFQPENKDILRGAHIPYAQAYALDWNKDGDTDLLVASSYTLLYYFERSYIDDGVIPGRILRVEVRHD